MSFTERVKEELCATLPKKNCCRKALFYGMLAIRGYAVSENDVVLRLDGNLLLDFSAFLFAEEWHEEAERRRRFGTVAGEELAFSCPALAAWLKNCNWKAAEKTWKCPVCRRAYFVGIFLAGGRVCDPAKEYLLEISCGARRDDVQSFLSLFDLHPKTADRRAERLLYFRNSTEIEEVFTHMGAPQACFSLMDSKIEREMRNDANRQANCDANNIQKTVEAAFRQVESIRKLMAENRFSSLPPELEKTARLRLQYPDMPIGKLAGMSDPPLTKSGLNHRLRKITEIAGAVTDHEKGGN